MGGGSGVQWKFWFDEVDLVYHPYAKQCDGVLVAKTQPDIIEFEARGYMDGMSHVRGDLFVVSDFKVVVPWATRDELAEIISHWQHSIGSHAGFTSSYGLFREDHGYSRGAANYEEMLWRGFGGRGKVGDNTFSPHGDIDIDIMENPVPTWSCNLAPTEMFQNWFKAVFDELDEIEDEDDRDLFWEDIQFCYGYKEKKHV